MPTDTISAYRFRIASCAILCAESLAGLPLNAKEDKFARAPLPRTLENAIMPWSDILLLPRSRWVTFSRAPMARILLNSVMPLSVMPVPMENWVRLESLPSFFRSGMRVLKPSSVMALPPKSNVVSAMAPLAQAEAKAKTSAKATATATAQATQKAKAKPKGKSEGKHKSEGGSKGKDRGVDKRKEEDEHKDGEKK